MAIYLESLACIVHFPFNHMNELGLSYNCAKRHVKAWGRFVSAVICNLLLYTVWNEKNFRPFTPKAIFHQAEFSAPSDIFFCLKANWRRVSGRQKTNRKYHSARKIPPSGKRPLGPFSTRRNFPHGMIFSFVFWRPLSANWSLKATFHSTIFDIPMRPVHEDQTHRRRFTR